MQKQTSSFTLRCFLLICVAFMTTQAAASADTKEQKVQAPLKYYIFREDCFDRFLSPDFQQRIMAVKPDEEDKGCLKFTISKGIGMAIIVGSSILKLPQIIKILSNGSVEGLSSISNYIETTIFMQTAGIAIGNGIAFSVYGESLIIMVQNFVVIMLIWQYNKSIGIVQKFAVAAFFAGYAYVLFTPGLLTQEHRDLISGSTIALTISARLPQIYTIFSESSTGALAFPTVFLQFGGSIARLGTVLVESDDWMFRAQYILGCCLNTIIILQFVCYWGSTTKANKVAKDKKDQ